MRHYGWHSAAAKAKLERVQQILQQRAKPAPAKTEAPKPKCPCCGKDMIWQRKIERPNRWMEALMDHLEERATGPPPRLIVTQGPAPGPAPAPATDTAPGPATEGTPP